MATLQGSLKYDSNRTNDGKGTGMGNIPIVLQDLSSGKTVAVNTDSNGNYTFTDVPDGNYQVVEKADWNPPPGATGSVSWNIAAAGTVITTGGVTPTLAQYSNVKSGSTRTDGVSATTMKVTVSGGGNQTVATISNGPVKDTPFSSATQTNAAGLTENYLTGLNNGTFGAYPEGSGSEKYETSDPYPINSGIPYATSINPGDQGGSGEYVIRNTRTSGGSYWWNMAGHTSGNEMDRFAAVNGGSGGVNVLLQEAAVQPNSRYLISAWIMNMNKTPTYTYTTWDQYRNPTDHVVPWADPKLKLVVTDQSDNELYSKDLGKSLAINTNMPEWNQVGDVIQTRADTTSLKVKFVSTGSDTQGNDYSIDDVQVLGIPKNVPQGSGTTTTAGLTPTKSQSVNGGADTQDPVTARSGDQVIYTVKVKNTLSNAVSGATFKDILPNGITFTPGSVTINGASYSTYDPNNGFNLPSPINSGQEVIVKFNATVNATPPSPNPAANTANTAYSYIYNVDNGAATTSIDTSNTVKLTVSDGADVTTEKTSDKTSYKPGDDIIYTITVKNAGPGTAAAPKVSDTLPGGVTSVSYSTNGGATWTTGTWPGSVTLPDIASGQSAIVVIRGKVDSTASGSLSNTATTTTTSPDKNGNPNNTSSGTTPNNPSVVQSADLTVTKTADKKNYLPGETVTYTITVKNAGPGTAAAPKVSDAVPAQLESSTYSINGGTSWGSPWPGNVTLEDLPSGQSAIVLIKGVVGKNATGSLANSASVTSDTPRTDGSSTPVVGKTADSAAGDPSVTDTADVTTAKTADKTTYLPGETVTYTVTVTNAGPAAAKAPTISDTIPSAVQNPQYSVDNGATWQTWPASNAVTIADIAANSSSAVLIRGTVSNAATGSLANSATTTTSTPNKSGNPNTSTGSTSNSPNGDPKVTDTADVTTAKTADKTSYLPGEEITYTVTVTNAGPAAAKAPTISDTIPSAVQNPQYSVDNGATWQAWPASNAVTVADIAANSSSAVLIRGTVSASATGSLANSATTTTSTPNKSGDPNTSTGTTSNSPGGDPKVTDAADISTAKTADKASYLPGDDIVYTITVTNAGPGTAKAPTVTDELPTQIENPLFNTDGSDVYPAANVWTGSTALPADLPAGGSATVKIKGKVSASATGSLANSATAATATPGKDGSPATGTGSTSNSPNGDPKVTDTADVTTAKTADKASYLPGEEITYTVTVKNAGPAAAKAPTITDTVPSAVQNPQYSLDNGAVWQTWPASNAVTVADIAANSSSTVLIRGTVSASATGSLANSATTTTSTPNKSGDPNTSTGTTSNSPNGDPKVTDAADISTAKTADKASYLPGDDIVYTITVTNAGPGTAKTPTVTDELPAQIENPLFNTDESDVYPAANVWTGSTALAADLPAGGSATVKIKGKVNTSATGSLANSATAATATPGKDGSPATGTGTTSNSPNGDPKVTDTADVTTAKTADKASYLPGEEITYTVTVKNAGPAAAKAPTITDTVPSNVQNPQYSLDNGAVWQAWPTSNAVTVADIAANSSSTVLIRGTVSASATGSLANSATTTTSTPNKSGDPNTSTGTTSNSPGGDPKVTDAADISTAKTADKASYLPGDDIVYTITVTNAGPGTAKAPTVTDELPTQIENPLFNTDGSDVYPAANVWTGSTTLPADLPAGGSATVKIKGKVNASATGSLANSATAATTTPGKDGNPATGTGTTSNSPNGDPKVTDTADVTTAKTADKASYLPGEEITYTVTVKNAGPAVAKAPTVSDTVPSNVQNPQYSLDNGATWQAWPASNAVTVADIAANSSSTVLIKGTVSASATGSLANSATTTTSTPNKSGDPNTSTGTTSNSPGGDPKVTDAADISTVKTADKASYLPGDDIVYTITVTNAGPGTAKAPTITDTVPSNVQNPQYSVDNGATWQVWPASNAVTVADIAANSSSAVLIRGTVSASATGSLANSATAATATPGKDGSPATGTGTTSNSPNGDPKVTDTADVTTGKTADKTSYLPGEEITYTVTVKNAGPAVAKAPTVSDTVPSAVQNPQYSLDNGATWQAWPASNAVTVADIAANSSSTVLIRGTVNASATGSLANSATTTTSTPNKSGDPNTSTGTTSNSPGGDPKVTDAADISTAKTADKASYLPGDDIVYTITVTNAGPGTAKAPTVTDELPAQIENPLFNTDGSDVYPAANVWTGSTALPADLSAGGSATVKIKGTVSASATGSLANSATAATATPGKDGNPATGTGSTSNSPNGDPKVTDTADVTMTKSSDKIGYLIGDSITYTVTVKNAGPGTAAAPTITDTVPSNVQNPQYSLDNGATWQAWPASNAVTVADIAANSSSTVLIRGTVSGTIGDSLSNTATMTTATPGKDGSPGTGTATTPNDPAVSDVSNPPVADIADLTTAKTAGKKNYLPGEEITYTIMVTNAGPGAAKTPTLTDTTPANVQNPQYSVDNGATWQAWPGSLTLPDLAAQSNALVLIKGTISNTATGSLANSATVTSTTPHTDGTTTPSTGNTSDSPGGDPLVTATAEVTTAKSADKASYLPGDDIVYTVTVTNAGPATAAAPTVSDTLPAQIENPLFNTDGSDVYPAANVWTGSTTLADLPSGQSVKVKIKGKVSASATGSLANSATVHTDTPNKTGGSNTTTGRTSGDTPGGSGPGNGDPKVTDTADVTTQKVSDKTAYLPGEDITYTITVTNAGPAEAKTPTVSDTVPFAVQSPQYSVDNGATWQAWPGSLILPDLAANSNALVLIKGTISSTAAGSLSNSATTTTSTPSKTGGDNTTTGTTPGNPGVGSTADVTTAKSADKASYLPGDDIVYTITVTNAGPATAAAPTVSDTLPAQIENPLFNTDGSDVYPAANVWTGSTTLADLPSGQSAKVKIKGKVSASATGSLANSATTHTDTPNKTGGSNTTTGRTSGDTPGGSGPGNGDPKVTDTADVTTQKVSDKTAYLPGEDITYTITVTNAGPAEAKAPTVTDTVPSAVQNPQYSVDNGATWQAWPGSLTLPDLAANSNALVLIKGTISNTAAGSLSNSATTTTSTPSKTGGDNTTTGTTPGNPGVGSTADVTTAKSADKASYLPGDDIVYTVTVTNAGPATAVAPTVSDTLPAQIENPLFNTDGSDVYPAANVWTGSTTLADLPSGQSVKVKIKGKVSASATGSLANSATTHTDTPNKTGGSNTTTGRTSGDTPGGSGPGNGDPKVTDTAEVTTQKVSDKTAYLPGEDITYTITVTNAGPAEAKTPIVTDTVPSAVQNPQYSVDNGATWQAWPGSLTLPDLAANSNALVLIKGTISNTAAGSLSNSATTTTSTPSKTGGDNTTTGTTPGNPGVGSTADVTTAKSADKASYLPGDDIVYTITVTNTGPATAAAPTVSDTLPAQIENPLFNTDGSDVYPAANVWTGSTTLADLPSGQSVKVKIKGKVSASATGSLANSATTHTDTPNKTGGSNTTTGRTSGDTPGGSGPGNGDPKVTDTADVTTQKVSDKTAYLPGEDITYTITVTNAGPAEAKTPTVTDTVPSAVQNPQYSVDNGATWQAWPGSLTLPDLAANSNALVLIKGKVSANATGSLSNSATTTTSTPSKTGGDNTTTGTTPGNPGVGNTADVTTAKSADKTSYLPGDEIVYTITVTNAGPATAAAPAVSDTLPAQIENPLFNTDGSDVYPAANVWTGSTTLADLPSGQSVKVKIKGKVSASATGSLANSATTHTDTHNKTGGSNTTTGRTSGDTPGGNGPGNGDPKVTDTADVTTQKVSDKTAYLPGEDITYTITVMNAGPAEAKTPVVSDTVPSAVQNPQYSVDNGATWQAWPGSLTLPDLAANSNALVLIKGTISNTATGSLSNSATTTTSTPSKTGGDNTTTGTTPSTSVTPTSDLVTRVSVDLSNPKPGDSLTYTVTTTNNGPSAANTPTISYNPPSNLTNVEYSTDGGKTWNPWPGTTTRPDIPDGGTDQVLIRGKVPESVTTPVTSIITTTSATNDPTPENNTIITTTPVREVAQVTATKSADKAAVKPGEMLTYTITVINSGPSPAKAPLVSDKMHDAILNPQYSIDGGVTWQPWTGNVTLADLPAGANATVLARGTLSSSTPPGVLSNTATVNTLTPGLDGTNTPVTSTTSNTNVTPVANLTMTVTPNKDNPIPGDDITYLIVVQNNGPATAVTPEVTFRPPRGLSDMEYSTDGGLTWNPWTGTTTLPDIPNGGITSFLVIGKVDGDATTITTDTTARSATDDPNAGNNTVTTNTSVKETADVTLIKTADKTAAKPGDMITYTLTVVNNGPAVATTPTVSDNVPAGAENPQYSLDNGASWAAWTGSVILPDIAPGGEFIVLLRATISESMSGDLKNTATLSTPTPGKDGANTPVTTTTPATTVTPTSDLTVTVTVDNPIPSPGGPVTYTVTVKNNGPSTAQTPIISYTPPPNLTNVEYSTDGGKTWNPWTGTTTLTDIPNGDTGQALIRGKVPDNVTTPVTSTITVTGKGNDPNPGDNTVTIHTPVDQSSNIVTTVTVDNNTPQPGDAITYTVTVKNDGPAVAQTPSVTYRPPRGLTDVEYSTDGGKTWNTWTGTTTLTDIPNGGTDQVLIRGKVDLETPEITSTITTISKNPDPDSSDNTVTIETSVIGARPTPPAAAGSDLVTTVTVDKPSPNPGDQVTYTVTVKNNGPDTAATPEVSFRPPRGLTDVEYSTDGGKTWNPWTGTTTLTDIPNGGTSQVQIRGNIDGDATRVITSTVTVTGNDQDPNPGDNTQTVEVTVSSGKCCIVLFDSGMCRIWRQAVPCGSPVMQPETPCRLRDTFAGWFTDCRFTNKWDFNAPVNGNMTLYAKWTSACGQNQRPCR